MSTRREFLAAASGAVIGHALLRLYKGDRVSASDDILVMLRRDERDLFDPPCGAERCAAVDVSTDDTPAAATAAIGVITGHSAPPDHVLGRRPDEIMTLAARACRYGLVLDTCYGMSDTLLKPLVAAGFRGFVVGPVRKLPSRGLVYGPAFFDRTAPIAERLAAVQDPAGLPLVRWAANPRDLDEALRRVKLLGTDELARGLVRRHPHLYLAHLGGTAKMLVDIPVERFAVEENALTPPRSPT